MIDRYSKLSGFRFLAIATTMVVLSACTQQESEDFCDNHYLFHEAHLDSIGSLELTHSSAGTVQSEFSVPTSIIDAQTIDRLSEILDEPDRVFSFRTGIACRMTGSNVTSDADLIVATYEMDCGAGTRIEQVDVLLFDVIEELDEIEVHVTTPATQKRFAINRQCDSPIFRLRDRGEP